MKQVPEQSNKLNRNIFLSYAITFIAINLADSLTMLVDSIVISRGLGAPALGAIGLADPSFKIASLFPGVLAAGLQALCAQAMGSGNREKINEIFSAGIMVTVTVSAILSIIGFACTGSLCRLFGAQKDSELYHYLFLYLRGWFTGLPGYIFFFAISPLVTLNGNKKLMTIAMFIQSAINIIGDIICVFVLDSGTFGVGFSTGLAYNISAVILLLSFFRKESVFKLFSARPDFSVLPSSVRLGLPEITLQVCKTLAPLLINRTIISIGGSIAMSAISIKTGLYGFFVVICKGIAQSISIMTLILYSEKDAVSIRQAVKIGFRAHLTFDTLLSVLLFAFAGLVSGFYFPSGTEEWRLAVMVIRFLALSLLLNGCNLILTQYLLGAGLMLPAHIMTLFQRMLSLTVFTMLLGRLFGVVGLFAAIPVSEAAVLLGYLAITLMLNRGTGFWNSILLIPDQFGYNSENSFSVSISTVEEAVAVSERIESFCNQHQVDRRTSYFSARCMEELSTNIILNGFTKDNKKHHCDIRVMIDSDEVVLRLRDDCQYFNIRERFDSLADDDVDASVWIRLVFALAKDVNYINIFNTNTLIIKM